ncbi:MAG: hypothetical protein J6C41_08480 [Oscillospiraceae bacterium]|nr:hypothetical protein [Oscillospiraceae bacterium]
MKLTIDGKKVEALAGQSLLDILKAMNMAGSTLLDMPIAAKIAGEVFNLNYIPLRIKDEEHDRPSMRRAMAASNGVIQLLRVTDPAGRDVYDRTVQFVLFLALHQLWPNARVKMGCTVGPALYVEVPEEERFNVDQLRTQVCKIIEQDIALIRHRISTEEAMAHYKAVGQEDKAKLLSWRTIPVFDVYSYGDFMDYYYGELAPSTSYLRSWKILPAEGGFLFVYPDELNPEKTAHYEEMPNFMTVSNEGARWCELMGCETVADLNTLVESGKIRELIRVNEALHEKRFSQVADMVCQRGAKFVMLAGPSSSGKTTSANRLATQLRVHGKAPILMGLDDYYIDRDLIKPGPDGTIDLEHINTIDTDLFRENLADLLAGKEVEIPTFDFKTGSRVWKGHKMTLRENTVIIVEGLHALNPVLLPKDVDTTKIFKLYVSPLLPLNLDDHNRIPTSYLRLLRRTVRDFEARGATVARTMSMWDSVRRGEKRWIFPFQEQADLIFNSSTLYELAVLKKHIYPLLDAVQPEEDCYDQVRSIVKVLNYVLEADVDDEIPPTSLVREFIGGNTFYK